METRFLIDHKSPSTSMSLDVWKELEGQLAYLNDHNVTVDFFQGFNAQGPGAGDISWSAMSEETKRWWVSYVIARMAAFANIGGFQYAWYACGKTRWLSPFPTRNDQFTQTGPGLTRPGINIGKAEK
jgi:hypothetical protein